MVEMSLRDLHRPSRRHADLADAQVRVSGVHADEVADAHITRMINSHGVTWRR